ncbi:MAG: hypothetical protein MZV49_22385 [Rhodopseudomonas palustris]|nr:hypothetical protein [Rhodopseudomonas palustris]
MRCPMPATISGPMRWRALCKARVMTAGFHKSRQRLIGRLHHLLAKQAARQPNLHHLDDFHAARALEASLTRTPARRPNRRPGTID